MHAFEIVNCYLIKPTKKHLCRVTCVYVLCRQTSQRCHTLHKTKHSFKLPSSPTVSKSAKIKTSIMFFLSAAQISSTCYIYSSDTISKPT